MPKNYKDLLKKWSVYILILIYNLTFEIQNVFTELEIIILMFFKMSCTEHVFELIGISRTILSDGVIVEMVG